jgi:hypothetical protein
MRICRAVPGAAGSRPSPRSNRNCQHFSRCDVCNPRYVKSPQKIKRIKWKEHVFVKLTIRELVARRSV